VGRGEQYLLPGAVEADHLAVVEAETVPVRLGQVVELVLVPVHAAGRDLVQQRLPEMPAGAVHQRDGGPAAAAERDPERRRQLQAGGAASHHHDLVQRRLGGRGRRDVPLAADP